MENQSPHIPSGWIHMKFVELHIGRVRYPVGRALPHMEKRGRYIRGLTRGQRNGSGGGRRSEILSDDAAAEGGDVGGTLLGIRVADLT
jgi:hypothetical protein